MDEKLALLKFFRLRLTIKVVEGEKTKIADLSPKDKPSINN